MMEAVLHWQRVDPKPSVSRTNLISSQPLRRLRGAAWKTPLRQLREAFVA